MLQWTSRCAAQSPPWDAVRLAARAHCARPACDAWSRADWHAWAARRSSTACACARRDAALCRQWAFSLDWTSGFSLSTHVSSTARHVGSRERTNAAQAHEPHRTTRRYSAITGRLPRNSGAMQENDRQGIQTRDFDDRTAFSFQFCAVCARNGVDTKPATTRAMLRQIVPTINGKGACQPIRRRRAGVPRTGRSDAQRSLRQANRSNRAKRSHH